MHRQIEIVLFSNQQKDGYLTLKEFQSGIEKLYAPLKNAPLEAQEYVFKNLAIRRPKKRDRLYFYVEFVLDTWSDSK